MEVLNIDANSCKIALTDKGFLICPKCHAKIRGVRVRPGTVATELEVRCRTCKTDYVTNINTDSGQSGNRQRP